MDNTTIYDLNATKIINDLNTECLHTYVGVIMGALLFISEILPFIQAKSKCHKEPRADVVDELCVEEVEQTKRPTLLQEGNGLLHTCVSFYLKMRK